MGHRGSTLMGPKASRDIASETAALIKQHKAKDFWVQALVFVSKDENLTKEHIRFFPATLECRSY